MKYLTASQTLDVTYEGVSRRFKVVSVSTHAAVDGDETDLLAHDLQNLDISQSSKLWTVGWDTVVTIVDETNGAHAGQEVSAHATMSYPGTQYHVMTAEDGCSHRKKR